MTTVNKQKQFSRISLSYNYAMNLYTSFKRSKPAYNKTPMAVSNFFFSEYLKGSSYGFMKLFDSELFLISKR